MEFMTCVYPYWRNTSLLHSGSGHGQCGVTCSHDKDCSWVLAQESFFILLFTSISILGFLFLTNISWIHRAGIYAWVILDTKVEIGDCLALAQHFWNFFTNHNYIDNFIF